jgi:uncharacterized protein
MINRTAQSFLGRLASYYPVVVVTRTRQSGKTTLVKKQFPNLPYVNLEAPDVRTRVQADPNAFLAAYSNAVIIDEFQRIPELVSYIQVAVDSKVGNGRFVLTGSQQFEIMNKVTQSLAGRLGILKLLPFSIPELQSAQEGTTSKCKCAFVYRVLSAHLRSTYSSFASV